MRDNDYVQMCSQQKTCRFKLTKLKSIDHTQSEHGKVRAANNCKNGEKHYS
jgi:hypothetical protein